MTARTSKRLPVASISLDLDNLWSYLKTHGDPSWRAYPSFIPVVVPRLLELFDEHRVTGTVFVVGKDTEFDENCEAIALISAAGHEVGNHSYHHEPWLHEYSPAQIDEELAQAEEGLARVSGRLPVGFRAPGYCVSSSLLQALERRGYAYDASTLPTWIGPFARAYYFRSAQLTPEERQTRARLFGRAREVVNPLHPYRWRTGRDRLVEIPVTTMPMLRVPIHFSYLIYLHQVAPWAARAYFRTALDACTALGISPSLLLHPLDLLDRSLATNASFFPGMGVPVSEKRVVIDWALREMGRRFTLVGAEEHAASLSHRDLPVRELHHD